MSQGYNDRLDERLGEKDGAERTKTQSLKDRRDESRGASHHHRSGGSSFDSLFAEMKRTNASAGHNAKCNHPAGK